MAKTPSKKQKRITFPGLGIVPYRILETVIMKNTSVSTEPHRWILANSGIPKSTISLRRYLLFRAHSSATPSVAAEDMVPTAVRYAGP